VAVSGKSILIVEDAAPVRELVAQSLRTAGYSVQAVELAARALDVLRSTRFDLVMLDLGMPRGTMDGMELLARIREVEEWSDLPVIILSGYGDIVNREVTRRLGVAAILGKPLRNLEELVAAVEKIVGSGATAPS
jgi:two-component system, chemotaxis family, chemotaxis protein CheY